MRSFAVALVVLCLAEQAGSAQEIPVRVDLSVKHEVGGVAEFDRKKFITMHSSLLEPDWDGEDDKLAYLLEELDVYFGRDNGIMRWIMNHSTEDPARPGYADPEYVTKRGKTWREMSWGTMAAHRHQYEAHEDIIIGGQEQPFWPGNSTDPPHGSGIDPYKIAGGEASGDFMGRFLNAFYRNEGQSLTAGPKRPRFLEIINEPLYSLVTMGGHSPRDVFEFHNSVADAIRRQNSDVLIGGYTTAFPFFDENNFQRWEERMKLFLDLSGEKMDFLSIHFYDFNKLYDSHRQGYRGPVNFKGSRIEATLDMLEHYCTLKFGKVKPLVISEYGGRDHSQEGLRWSPLRDWQVMKAFSPLMMSFMERPNVILKAIPFMIVKAEWGRTSVPYPWRLLRQAKEAQGEKGEEWVFSELIKFYQLWSDVNGTRVETRSTNPDMLVDAYLEGNTAHVILSNLNNQPESVALKLSELPGNEILSIHAKHLHLVGSRPELELTDLTPEAGLQFSVDSEATAILTYTMAKPISPDQTMREVKYFAETYHQDIHADVPAMFDINDVEVSERSEGILRIGFGRKHRKSKTPELQINGVRLDVPDNYRGGDQRLRDRFFGLLEVVIPNGVLKATNSVSITFPDKGGYISSVALQVFSK